MVTDPSSLVKEVDMERYEQYRVRKSRRPLAAQAKQQQTALNYVEPHFQYSENSPSETSKEVSSVSAKTSNATLPASIKSKVVTLGDFIDTDAVRIAKLLLIFSYRLGFL